MANFTGYLVGFISDEILKEKEFDNAEKAIEWMVERATTPIGVRFPRVFIVDSGDNNVGEFQFGKPIFPEELVKAFYCQRNR